MDLVSELGFLPNRRDARRITKITELDVTQRNCLDGCFWVCWFNFSFYLTFRFKTFLEIIFKDGFSETCVLTVLHLLNPKLKTRGAPHIHGLLERSGSKFLNVQSFTMDSVCKIFRPPTRPFYFAFFPFFFELVYVCVTFIGYHYGLNKWWPYRSFFLFSHLKRTYLLFYTYIDFWKKGSLCNLDH